MLRSRRLILFIFLCTALIPLLLYSASRAQDSGVNIQILGINTKNHPQIEITVSVVDSVGRPINGLTSGDFTVLEDGKPIAVKSTQGITDENIPLSIVLVIDTSRSMSGVPLTQAKTAADAFVDQVRDIDELALVSFDTKVREVQSLTKDKTLVKSKIDSLTAQGQTALYDAVAQAVKTAQASTNKRRVIVLLTDGNEFGNLSQTKRNDSFGLADKAGIPIFTIGLGFEIDAAYLKEAAQQTGGQFYASPKPDQLGQVYTNIATTLRSLYVIDVTTAQPTDGSMHQYVVQFKGQSSAAVGTRMPAPIPVIHFSGLDPNTPISKPTEVTPNVIADNKLVSYTYQIDNTPAATGTGDPKSLTLDPAKLTPGAHQLSLSITDDQGHVGQGSQAFQVAVLPPDFSIDGLKSGEVLTANRAVTLKINSSQTPPDTATFDIDGTVLATIAQAPYTATIDVLQLVPGPHRLNVRLTNKGGGTGTASIDFVVSPGPRQTATAAALRQATLSAAQTLTAQPTHTPTPTRTFTPSKTPTASQTPTATSSTTPRPSNTLPPTATHTSTPLPTTPPQPTSTIPNTVTSTPAASATPSRTATAAPTSSNTSTSSPTNRPTNTNTSTPSPTSTATNTPLPSNTATPTSTATNTPAPSDTSTPTLTATNVPSSTPTPTATPLPPQSLLGNVGGFLSTPTGLLFGGGLLLLIIIVILIMTSSRRGRT